MKYVTGACIAFTFVAVVSLAVSGNPKAAFWAAMSLVWMLVAEFKPSGGDR